ncbi:hypothetical protein EI94DRAFT_1796764 [Lactarius quietus]|nr:hypothetical protein EI94DRAFT_1796764 [Lactarius quietus]
MAHIDAGSVILSTAAQLEQQRVTAAEIFVITFDALLPCQNNIAISPLLCNARYLCHRAHENVQNGFYHICIRIMPYQPNVHLPSPLCEDDKFTFLGEIIELYALPLPFNIIHTDIPSLIVAIGTVTEVHAEDVSFSISVTQLLAAGLVVTLIIHTVTHAFSGKLISVEDQDPIVLLNNVHALNPLNNVM